MYIAGYYKLNHQPDKMISAYQEAARHYNALKSNTKNPLLNYIASNLLARCYTELKDWENALSTYNAMLSEYMGKTKLNMDGVLMQMAVIYSKELKQKDKTKEALSLLLKHYPRSRYRNVAAMLLKEMSKNE